MRRGGLCREGEWRKKDSLPKQSKKSYKKDLDFWDSQKETTSQTDLYLVILSSKTYETVLMMGHNIHFKGVIWEIVPKLSFYPFLFGALEYAAGT